MAFFPWLAAALTSFFGYLVKHPFVLKMMFFTFFVLAIHRMISFVLNIFKPDLLVGGGLLASFLNLLCYFGVIAALQMFVSIIISGFAAKQLLAFMRT